jgi:uncharacterized damage-inducible protein DinB
MPRHIYRLFEHIFWADTQVLAMFDEHPEWATPDALRYFSHVLASERAWLMRLRGEDSGGATTWPVLSVERMHQVAASNADGFGAFLRELSDADVDVDVVYADAQGVPHRNSIADILLHVALHGSYHRGQLALVIRRDGGTPVKTDFIAFARMAGPG